MIEKSRKQFNDFQSDKRTNGVSQDFFVRDGKVFYTAAVAARKSKLGYASDHVTRLARQGKILAVYEKGKWFVDLDSVEGHTKKAEENRKLGGLKAVGKLDAVLSSRLQEKTPGSDWGSSHGDGKPNSFLQDESGKLVLSGQPDISSGQSVLSTKSRDVHSYASQGEPVIDGYDAETGYQKTETKPGGFLFSGYTHPALFWNWVHRTANRAIILLAVLLFVAMAGVVGVKKSDFIVSHLPAEIVSLLAHIEQSVETVPLISEYDAVIQKLRGLLTQKERQYQELVNKYQRQIFVEEGTGGGVAKPSVVATKVVLSYQFSNSEASILKDIAKRISTGGLLFAPQSIDIADASSLIDELNSKLIQLSRRVDQIPPPLQFIGGGGGGTTVTVGGGDAQVTGSKLTVGNTIVNSGSIGTTSGNFSIDSSGGTTTISDNLTVTGSTTFNGVAYGWPSADGSANQRLTTNGSGTLSWATVTGGGGGTQIEIRDIPGTYDTNTSSLSFDGGKFTLTASGSAVSINLDWGAGGPASLSQDETITGKWLFSAASVQFNTTTFELAGAASVSVANANYNINLNGSGDFVIQDAGTAIFASASAIFGAGLNIMSGTTGCSGATADKLLYTATTGKFSCGTDQNSGVSAASIFNGVEVGVIGGTPVHVGSISFDDGHFNITNTASQAFVRLDWTSAGGPASLSQDETITGKWLFSAASSQFSNILEIGTASVSSLTVAGASVYRVGGTDVSLADGGTGASLTDPNADRVFFWDDSAGATVLAGFSSGGKITTTAIPTLTIGSDSLDFGEFLDAMTLDANLTIASTSSNYTVDFLDTRVDIADTTFLYIRGTASASIFQVPLGSATLPSFTFSNDTNLGIYSSESDTLNFATNGALRFALQNSGASFSYKLEINASSSRAFVITDLGGTQEDIFVVDTTASGSNPGLDINATTLANGNSAFTITVPASTSTQGFPAGVLKVTAGSQIVASMSGGGKFAIRGGIFSHGATSTCVNVDPGTTAGCIDLAENFPTADNTLVAGEVVSINPSSSQDVSRAMPGSTAIGVISTNPAALITGNAFVTGVETVKHIPGYVPVALAGRVPVKVSTENGPIKVGDYLTNSSTQPGLAMKAAQAGQAIGQALTAYGGKETGEVVIFVQSGFYGGPGLDAASGISTSDPTFEAALLTKFAKSGGSKLKVAKNSQEMQLDILAASNEIITPRLFANEVITKTIKNQPGKDLRVELERGKSLVISSSNSAGLTIDGSGNAVFSGQVTADTINANHINGLDIITNQISVLSGSVASLSAPKDSQILNDLSVNNNLTTLGTFTALGVAGFNNSALFNGQTQFLGDATFGREQTASTSLTVYSDALFRRSLKARKILADEIESPTLTAITDQIINLASASNDIKTSIANLEKYFDLASGEKLNIKGGLIVAGETAFIGRVYFNDDTAGFAIIRKGSKTADIKFTQKYAQQPIVNVTISLDAVPTPPSLGGPSVSQEAVADLIFNSDVRYLINNKSSNGFTIILNKPAPVDIGFSWSAIAVKDAKIIVGEPAPLESPSLTGQASPSFSEPILTPSSLPEQSPTPIPLTNPDVASTPTSSSPLSSTTPSPTPDSFTNPDISSAPSSQSLFPTASITSEATPEPNPTPSITPETTLEPMPEPTPLAPKVTPEVPTL
ncbi:MAG: hypothetical protein HYX20_01480 [Candidatus Yanofskybacteria bacterium]|nr:hypothetical protein [Candidatus Yanofskybacteria bacterium]